MEIQFLEGLFLSFGIVALGSFLEARKRTHENSRLTFCFSSHLFSFPDLPDDVVERLLRNDLVPKVLQAFSTYADNDQMTVWTFTFLLQ